MNQPMLRKASAVPWWESFYDEHFARLSRYSEPQSVDAAARFLQRHLGLRPGDTVLDQCCGTGRLSKALLRLGLRVIAIDQAEPYIAALRAEEIWPGAVAEFHVADARTYQAERTCDVVINWATSFGYAQADEENRALLCRAKESLRIGGHLALDYHNIPGLLRRFAPCQVLRQSLPEGGELLLLRETEIDLSVGLLRQRWTYLLPDGERQVRSGETRLYLPHDLARLAREAGLDEVTFYGSTDGDPLTIDSPRCILIARRMAQK